MRPMSTQRLGSVVAGSLTEGLTVRLEAACSVEDLRVGQFVVIQGERHRFFSMISDVRLEAANRDILADPPADDDDFVRRVLGGTTIYGTLNVTPMLMLATDVTQGLQPVRTVPRHFAPVERAAEEHVALVFGAESQRGRFQLGMPLDMDVPVCLDLQRFIERSNGVFGRSGTGKSFLTRLLLCGVIKADVASVLVFDMHSEYGWDSRAEDGAFVKGLRQLFGPQVLVYSLDPASSRRRGVAIDSDVVIGLNQIEVEDVILLQDELNLTATAAETAYLLVDHFRDEWLRRLLAMSSAELEEFALRSGAHGGALAALKRKLERLTRLPFVKDEAAVKSIDGLIAALAGGKHVVLEFGQHNSALAYMLVANIITRRIHQRWVDQTERYLHSKNEADRPRPLMITVEEAHKFLNPQAARQTIFGTIARELRKYSVTLLIVDQRPSAIDHEVMSQLGSRITALLSDERDIDAVFTGVGGAAKLRAVLAALDTRQQALILGHAVPMPVVIRTRPYDEAFYAAVAPQAQAKKEYAQVLEEADELF
ncbi:ATP-binding protein [Kallotenue papyrolyticum]|uniref:helicase HerA domain-containing protein n=1 Tax=Kallotenue papyrolyticum TaxID=1325125 RepID=UPI0009DFE2B0